MFVKRSRAAAAEISRLESLLTEALGSIESLAQEVRALREDYASSPAVAIATRDYTNHPNVHIGADSRLAPDVNLMASGPDYAITIGSNVKINRRSELCGPITIGNRTFINSDAYIRQQTRIGDRVLIGPYCRLISDTHALGNSWQRGGRGAVAPITIEDGVWLGANVTVIGPVTIGAGAMVAAGAVVTKDVPANTMVGGVPAKMLRQLD